MQKQAAAPGPGLCEAVQKGEGVQSGPPPPHLNPTILGWLEGRIIEEGVNSLGSGETGVLEGRRGLPAHNLVLEEGEWGREWA